MACGREPPTDAPAAPRAAAPSARYRARPRPPRSGPAWSSGVGAHPWGPLLYRDLRAFTRVQTIVGCPPPLGGGTYEGTLVAPEGRMRSQLTVITLALVGLAAPTANAAPTLTYGPIIARGATPDK